MSPATWTSSSLYVSASEKARSRSRSRLRRTRTQHHALGGGVRRRLDRTRTSGGEYGCERAAFSSRLNPSAGHKHRCGLTKPQPTLETCYEDTIAAAHSAWTYYPAERPRGPEGRGCRHSPAP